VANGNGTATITVTVNDGQLRDQTVKRTFNVTVNAINQPPTLNPIDDLTTNENSGEQNVSLSGITSGAANEKQKLTVTATSDNPTLIPDPSVSYVSPRTNGTLTFTPMTNATGTATITVTVNDGGKSNNIVMQTFAVTILDDSLMTLSIQSAIRAAPITTEQEPEPEPAAALGSPNYSNGQFSLTVTGTSGFNYVVQASSNMTDWASIQTNASPFTFVDPDAGQFNQRFYRAIYLP